MVCVCVLSLLFDFDQICIGSGDIIAGTLSSAAQNEQMGLTSFPIPLTKTYLFILKLKLMANR